MNQKKWIAELKSRGWSQGAGGKHAVKMQKTGQRPITLPSHKRRDYPTGLTRSIMREAGIDKL